MSLKPLCFVVMPFGQKPDPAGGAAIDFDRIYTTALAPAIEDADMEPIRADEERTGGIIHKPMFERLILCDYAVADPTTAKPKRDGSLSMKVDNQAPPVHFLSSYE